MLTLLKQLHACEEAVDWASTQPDLEAAWENCERADWMLWLLLKLHYQNESVLRTIAVRCVRETPLTDGRMVWDLLTDSRSRAAARYAARAAAGAAARYAAWAVAWDAAGDAAWAAAWDVAGDVAWDAAWAAAWDAAWAAATKAQVLIVRELIPGSVILELSQKFMEHGA